jgi:ketosteroid isomerase-like protein
MATVVDHPTEFSSKLYGFADSMDIDGYLTMFTDDARLRFGNAPLTRGKEAIRDVLTQLSWAIVGVRHKVVDEWRFGDQIIHKLELTYIRRDGSQVRIPAVAIYRLSGNLIREHQSYLDLDPVFD